MGEVIKLEHRGCDGSHWGVSDWYEDFEKTIKDALSKGPDFEWTTGWYSSKKEIVSACITSVGRSIEVEASVSDDFDTHGEGSVTIHWTADLDKIREALDKAWDAASENQKDNQVYAGYAIYHWTTKIPDWCKMKNVYPRETRKRYPKKIRQCVDYYIVDVMGGMDSPPGDYYFHWGWQTSEDEGKTPAFDIPEKTAEAFVDFASSLKKGKKRIGDWEIESWKE